MDILKELSDIANELDEQTLFVKNSKTKELLQRQSQRVNNILIKLASDEDFLGSYNPSEPESDSFETHEDDPNKNPLIHEEAYQQVLQEMEADEQDPVKYLLSLGYNMKDLKSLSASEIESLADKQGWHQPDSSF